MRVLNFLGRDAGDRIRAAVPDVDVVDADVADEPPPGLGAEVAFGGWGDARRVVRWLESAGVEWVQLPGTGIDGVAPEILGGDWVVTNSPGASAVPIAEFVLGAMLAFEKRLPEVWIDAPPRHWNLFRMGQLEGRTLGIVGFGGIGQAVARRALPFGMRVLAARRTPAPSPVPGVELVATPGHLLEEAHHLVLATPATARTRGLLDADAFARVRPGVHLVNVARGSLVDQDALRTALDDGRVARATLDTVEPEPLPDDHWLYRHPRVRLSAHVSWCADQLFDRPVEIFVENLRRRRDGAPLAHVVDLDEGY